MNDRSSHSAIVSQAGAGPVWAPLVHQLRGVRCLLLDRPGWGLSAPVDDTGYQYKTVVVDLLTGVLDALGVDRAHVVGLHRQRLGPAAAAARPSRVDRAVLIGAGPLVPEVRLPVFIRLLASPLGAILVRVPDKPGQLRRLGHGASLDAGRLDARPAGHRRHLATRDGPAAPGELQLVEGGGHAPWLDDPSQVGGHVRRFLAG